MDALISLPRKSRVLYRIDQEKLNKYHSENNFKSNNKHLISNIEEKNLFPIIQFLSNKLIHRKNISTQTTTFSRGTSELDISTSLSYTDKTITNNSNSSSIELDFSDKSYTNISIKTDSNSIEEYKFNNHSSKSKHSRLYIRSIVRHMLGDDTFNED